MKELELMLAVAREAAVLINEVYATDFDVEYKAPRDPVTLADRRANELICARLSAEFPGVPIVAEESDPTTFAGFRQAPRAFFVDPLDGTREFVKKNGEFVVMIGLVEREAPALGVIHAPATGDSWCAGSGAAFRVNADGSEAPLGVSMTEQLSEARIVSTRSHRSPAVEHALAALAAKKLDALGSAGLKCMEVASGLADAYVAPGRAGSRWDVCAGEALLRAAGGKLTDTWGNPIDYRAESLVNERGIVASNGKLHDEILDRLATVRRERG